MSAHPVTIGVLAFYLMLLIVIGLVSTRKSSGG